MPRGNRGRNGDDERQDERNHYWSLRDIPKFEGKGEQPFSHLIEFEDYLVASGVTVDEDENDPRVRPDIETSLTSLKHHLRTMQGSGIVCTLKKGCKTYTQLKDGGQ